MFTHLSRRNVSHFEYHSDSCVVSFCCHIWLLPSRIMPSPKQLANASSRRYSRNHNPEMRNRVRIKKSVFWIWLFLFTFFRMSAKQRQSMQELLSNPQKEDLKYRNKIDSVNRHFISKPGDEFNPRIAWLMSFPNSGTSFTMSLVAKASNRSTATNYASEVTEADASSALSIYPGRPEGPFWAGMSGKVRSPRQLPDKYIMVKTHCGARCVNCGPDQYVETPKEFLRNCASGHTRTPKGRGLRRKYGLRQAVQYPPQRVAKAIHIIRNPMNNIIARFHLDFNHKRKENDKKWLAKHPNNPVGFNEWCRDQERASYEQDIRFFGGVDKIPKAPCYGEFYKYAQWHNLVRESLLLIGHQIPVLTIYYEDYTEHFNLTTAMLLTFLELEQEGVPPSFSARTNYTDYFNSTQQEHIKSLIQSVANNNTWEKIQHYFEGV